MKVTRTFCYMKLCVGLIFFVIDNRLILLLSIYIIISYFKYDTLKLYMPLRNKEAFLLWYILWYLQKLCNDYENEPVFINTLKKQLIKFFLLSKNCYYSSIFIQLRIKTIDKVSIKTSSTQKKLGDRSMFEHVWTLKETFKSYEIIELVVTQLRL